MKYLGSSYFNDEKIQLKEGILDLIRVDNDDFLNVFVDDGKIIIMRKIPACTLCGTVENVKKMDPSDMWCHLCPDCLDAFKKLER